MNENVILGLEPQQQSVTTILATLKEFSAELEDKNSEEYKTLEAQVLAIVTPGYEQIADEKGMIVFVELEKFMAAESAAFGNAIVTS